MQRLEVKLVVVLVLATFLATEVAAQGRKNGQGGFNEGETGCFTLPSRGPGIAVFNDGSVEPYCHSADGQISVPKRFRYDPGKFNPNDREAFVNLAGTGCESGDDACLNFDRIVTSIQSQMQYTSADSAGFTASELDFTAMEIGTPAWVSLWVDFRVSGGGQGVRRLKYGTTADTRVRCPQAGPEPVHVVCTDHDGNQCTAWTLTATEACLFNQKTGDYLDDSVAAGWVLDLYTVQ